MRQANPYLRCYAEISLEAIRYNIREVKKHLPAGVRLLLVIKADAYGHGAVTVGKTFEREADYYAVATLPEACELRESGIALPILILGYISPSQYEEAIARDITPTMDTFAEAEAFSAAAVRLGKRARLHAALDTGMTRIGFPVNEEAADEIARIARLPGVELEGIFTHFAAADEADKTSCLLQLDRYRRMLAWLSDRGVTVPIRHVSNSAAIMELAGCAFDMVRSGIVTYGLYPSEEVEKDRLALIPALSWRSHVVSLREVGPGVGVGYGGTFVTEREKTRIATVSVGYADGYPRAVSGKGRVLIRGQYAPILGRVCMDQMMVDVTDIPGVEIEDIVTLIGADGSRAIPVEEVAQLAGSFNYEMVCRISRRVPRVYEPAK